MTTYKIIETGRRIIYEESYLKALSKFYDITESGNSTCKLLRVVHNPDGTTIENEMYLGDRFTHDYK